jgi:hypothetical protein
VWIVGALGALGALGACHHADAPEAAAPKGPTACARASDSIVQAMLDRLPADATPPTEQADATRNLIRERCEHDSWSAEATQCLIAMKQLEDAEPCAKLMTEDQQAALVSDQEAQLGTKPGQPASGAPPSRPAQGAPEVAPAADQAGKPKDNGASAESRDGGR